MRNWEPTDYDAMSRVYDAGRAMPEEWVSEWRKVLAELGIAGPVADVGSGTGIWASFLSEWFEVDVIGIEPSAGMRTQAAQNRRSARVAYVGGTAEHLHFETSRVGRCGCRR